MALTELTYINFTGGIVSPGYLKEVLAIASLYKIKSVRFGLRQQLILNVPTKLFAGFSAACREKDINAFRKSDAPPNIISSYPSVDIFTTDTWVREGVYKDIFNSFDYTPKLKINITDSRQTFVPFFTGHINWIASESIHFWYLCIRFPKTATSYCLPVQVYTNDLAAVSKKLEEILATKETTSVPMLFKKLRSAIQFISKPAEKELQLPRFSLPYYEGFNKYNNNYWLGIYRREEHFPVQFLADLCTICMKTKVGQIYTTPWKTIIIKGIETSDRNLWDYALGKYRINVRHAANELNWQVEDNCEEGLQIKRHIIRHFDKEDVRTYGLSFAVQTRPFSSMMGSVIIRKQEVRNPGRLKALERFEILYTADFNPNTSKLVTFRKGVQKEHFGTYLISLCKYFYERESKMLDDPGETLNRESTHYTDAHPAIHVHQCKDCFTTYEEALGDVENNIPAGTTFADLPSTYRCPLCEAGKDDFITVIKTELEIHQR